MAYLTFRFEDEITDCITVMGNGGQVSRTVADDRHDKGYF